MKQLKNLILTPFLPPDSPDFNPTEFIWKSINQELSQLFIKTKEEIRIDKYYMEVLPLEKVDRVREIQSEGLTVAMTGDSINDPAFAQANVSIAFSAVQIFLLKLEASSCRNRSIDAVHIVKLSKASFLMPKS